MTLSLKTLWAVKILLVLRKMTLTGAPLIAGTDLQTACVGADSDPYIYRRVLRELAAKTDYLISVFRQGKTHYKLNPDFRPTLYDLASRMDGTVYETGNGFWSFEHAYTFYPLHEVNQQFEILTRKYLSKIYIDELDPPVLSGKNASQTGITLVR